MRTERKTGAGSIPDSRRPGAGPLARVDGGRAEVRVGADGSLHWRYHRRPRGKPRMERQA